MTQSPLKDRRFATTLARGLAVLRAFRGSDNGLGNAEIAARTGLPKSTVSRLTFTLQSLGYLTHRGDLYGPGPSLLALGNVAQGAISFVDISAPIMQRLADETGTLSLLLVRDGAKLLIVRAWRPRDVSSLWLEVGQRIPFNGSSSGHALLAAMTPEQRAETVAHADGHRGLTAQRAETVRAAAFAQLVARGFVITPPGEYYAPNIHAVAKPCHTSDLAEPVVFASGALPETLSVTRMEQEVGPRLAASVEELKRIMGLSGG